MELYRQNKDEDEWQAKYNRLKRCYDETGGGKIRVEERDLFCWLSRQKRLLRNELLGPTRRESLREIGRIDDSSTSKCCGRKKFKRQQFDEKWQSQFENLKEYHPTKGNSNVPQQWKEDRSLGTWVCNQRKKYKLMKTGVADMDPERVQKLESLGFEWSWYDSKRELKR
jgi:hypothetical protein